MKKTILVASLFFGLSIAGVQAQLSPSPKKASIPEPAPETKNRELVTTSEPGPMTVRAGKVNVSLISVQGDKARKGLTVTLLLEHNMKDDVRVSSQNPVMVDDQSNQLRPGTFSVASLVSGVPTKDSFAVFQASPEATSLKIMKFNIRVYNAAAKQNDMYPVEFRDVPIKWN